MESGFQLIFCQIVTSIDTLLVWRTALAESLFASFAVKAASAANSLAAPIFVPRLTDSYSSLATL